MECEEAALMDKLVSYTHVHTCIDTCTHSSLCPLLPQWKIVHIRQQTRPVTRNKQSLQHNTHLYIWSSDSHCSGILSVAILPLLHIYHTIMCKVEVRRKKRMDKRKELTAKRGSASGGRRKFLHVSCYEYITVYNTVHVFNT